MKLARQWYFAVFGAIVLFRLLCLLDFVSSPFFVPIGGDRALYHNLAMRVFCGEWFPDVISFMPLYPVLLGLLYKIIGAPNLAVAAFCQIVLEGLTGILVMFLAFKHYGRVAALAAGGAYVFFGATAVYSLVTIPVSLGLFWIALTAVVADRWQNNWTFLRAAVMGLLLGCGGGLLGPFWLMVIPFAVWITLSAARSGPVAEKFKFEVSVFQQLLKYGNSIILALLVIAVAAATMIPSLAHNYRVERRIAPVSIHSGLNLYMGNNPDSTGYGTAVPGLRTSAEEMTADSIKLAGQLSGRPVGGAEASRFWTKKAFTFWRDTPGQGIILLFRKIHRTISIRDFDDIGLCRVLPGEIRPLRFAFVSFGLIWVCACIGFILSGGAFRGKAPFWIMGLSIVAGMLVTFVTARYRLPLAILLLPAAGGGVSELSQIIRRRTYQVKKYYLIPGLAGILIAITPHTLPETDATDNMNKAIYLYQAGRISAALEAAGRAVAREPGSAAAWFVIGNIYAARTNYPAALQSYERALVIQSGRVDALFNAGLVLEQMGRKPEALAYYQKTVALDPRHAKAWLGVAIVSRELGNEQSAREAIEKVAEIVGRDHPQIADFYGN